MLKKLPLYPILFSIFPVLSLAAHNISEISLDVILRPLFVSLLMGLILFGLMRFILRDWYRAALAVLTVIFFFFIYGQVYNILEDVTFGNVSIFRHRTLLPLYGILLVVLLYLIARRLKQPRTFTLWLNLLSIYLLIYPVSKIVLNVLQQSSANRAVHESSSQIVTSANQPDIYYIILDAYGREDILSNLLGYDNSGFLNSLRQRGFYVADCSQSNYAYTEFSLPSSLNYDYIDHLNVSHDRNGRVALLKHGAVRSFLKANGYKVVAFPTGWSFTEWKDADLYLDFEHPVTALTEFESLILDTTVVRVAYDARSSKQVGASRKDLRRLRILSLFENIKKLPGIEGDLFVFAHIVAPHVPYSFEPNGEMPAFKREGSTHQEIGTAYINQVKFINREILNVLDALIMNSEVPPIIIVQGDHGPLPDLAVNYSERMPILNAYYLPGVQMDKILYPSISPVNSFRVVLNSYFEQSLPLLEDESYFGPPDDRNEYQLVPNSCPNKP
jgi:hypothetical protein